MSKTFQKISKEDFIREIKWHQEQDMIIQGSYGDEIEDGEEFEGCFMGCAVNSIARTNGDILSHKDHKEQADYLGLPEWLVYLYKAIFEGLSRDDAKQFVVDCAEALPECETKDIDQLEGLIKIWIIESTKKYHDNKEVHAVVDQVKAAILSGHVDLLAAAESAAWTAAWTVAESARPAMSARSAMSAESARSAAWSAARSAARPAARSAAKSADWAARSAARSAAWTVAESADWAARSAYKELSEYVLCLLRGI